VDSQMDLFDGELQPIALPDPDQPERVTIEERFDEFHRMNPHVYEAIVAMVLYDLRAGVHHGSMKFIFERLRHQYRIQTHGREEYRLNNVFTALYARKVMAEYPEAAGFFETRNRTAAA